MVDEPLLALPWLVWLFASGMLPVGLMLGAHGSRCSPCCSPCPCSDGELPDTLTVTFDGLQNQTPGVDLCTLVFDSCFGSGAAGKVTAPGGDPATDKGPIASVSLTNGGSGYAKLGRVDPTVSVSGGSGSGATFTVTLTQEQDECNVDYWKVSAVGVSGGSGFVDGESLTFTVAEGDTEQQAAAATVQTTRGVPSLTASASPGSGASLSVSVTQNIGTPSTWGVSGVSVSSGGTGYVDGSTVTFALGGGDKSDYEAYAVIQTNRLQPALSASVSSENGSGASLSVTLSQGTDFDGRDVWGVSAVGITAGGSDYAQGDLVLVAVTDGTESPYSYFYATVSSVDGNGAITGVTVDYGGEYYKDGGVIQSVEVLDGGAYYNDDGVPTGVTVNGGGIYYREDASEPPYVASVSVTISQSLPSNGTGATLTATVEDDPQSADFGKIVSLGITSGGSDYLAWQWMNTKCCGDYYDGMSVVVKRDNFTLGSYTQPEPCRYIHRMCGVGNLETNLGYVMVEYLGPSASPVISIVSETTRQRNGGVSSDSKASTICNTTFTTTQTVANCDDWTDANGNPISFAAVGGATATLVAGGEYDPTFRDAGGKSCYICCKGEEEFAAEVEATVTDSRENPTIDASGTYVMGQSPYSWFGWYGVFDIGEPGQPAFVILELHLEPCSLQPVPPLPAGFVPDYSGCDDCHKKCRRWVVASLPGGSCSSFTSMGGDVDQCSLCEETPICTGAGKQFVAASQSAGCGSISVVT